MCECPCLFPHRVVLHHGFAGLPVLEGPCVACSRGALRGRALLFQYGYFGGSLGAFLPSFPSRAAQTGGDFYRGRGIERVAVDATDEKSLDPTVAISEVIPGDPDPETQILENALSTVYTYTDQILGEALDESNRLILRRRLLYLACMVAIPESVPQVRLRGDRIGYGDLCHYGWNVWNAFKGARNQFYDQSELAEWLKSGFESLGKYNTKTLRAKLRATDGGYGIRLVDNLKEYIQQ